MDFDDDNDDGDDDDDDDDSDDDDGGDDDDDDADLFGDQGFERLASQGGSSQPSASYAPTFPRHSTKASSVIDLRCIIFPDLTPSSAVMT